MEIKLCDYNTCLLAKEKGFNEDVYTCYSEATKLLMNTWDLNNIGCEGGLDYDDFFCNYNNQPNYEKYYDFKLISAIQQPVLQQWLREKHNIDIQVYPIVMSNNNDMPIEQTYNIEYAFRIYHKVIPFISKSDGFMSYEYALEQALIESLNII